MKWQQKLAVVFCSCTTTFALGLTQPCTRLDYLPPRASSLDHPRKTKKVSVHRSMKEVSAQSTSQAVTMSNAKQLVSKLTTSKEQILQSYPDVCEGIGHFQGWKIPYPVRSKCYLKQTPCRLITVHLKEAFQQEIDKMLKLGVLKPVH